MRIGGKDNFAITNLLGCLATQKLAGNQFDVSGGADTVRNYRIDLKKMSKIGKGNPLPQSLYGIGGKGNIIPLCKPEQSLRLDCTLQMDMEFNLWHCADKIIQGHEGHCRSS